MTQLKDLSMAGCCEEIDDVENGGLEPTTLGRIASYYYLHYTSIQVFQREISESAGVRELLQALCNTHEYKDLPVRHNEDRLNSDLIDIVRWPPDKRITSFDLVRPYVY